MSNSNTVCRFVVDTKEVLNNKIAETLVVELVSSEKLTRAECSTVIRKVQAEVSAQSNLLVDRILNEHG